MKTAQVYSNNSHFKHNSKVFKTIGDYGYINTVYNIYSVVASFGYPSLFSPSVAPTPAPGGGDEGGYGVL